MREVNRRTDLSRKAAGLSGWPSPGGRRWFSRASKSEEADAGAGCGPGCGALKSYAVHGFGESGNLGLWAPICKMGVMIQVFKASSPSFPRLGVFVW